MNYTVLTFVDGENAVTLGDNYRYTMVPRNLTVVYAAASPSVDEAGCTIDINDDGTGVVAGIDCSDKDVPGEWKSTHVGGANAPVHIAAGSKISLDANNAAANTVATVQLWCLVGEANA